MGLIKPDYIPKCIIKCHQGHDISIGGTAEFYCDCGAYELENHRVWRLSTNSKKVPRAVIEPKAEINKSDNTVLHFSIEASLEKILQPLRSGKVNCNEPFHIVDENLPHKATTLEHVFDKDFTKKGDFLGENETVKVNMMKSFFQKNFKYFDTGDLLAAQLMYRNGYKLLLVMPHNENDTKIIFDFSTQEINSRLKELLQSPPGSESKPLFVPKGEGKNSLLTDEEVSFGIGFINENEEETPLIFNRPFLAITLDNLNQAVKIDYIIF